MATVEAFEATLKDVVQAKRLSASKMTRLTDIALKCMEHDTQLVSIMFRTHKTLSSAAKIWSLYAFDALARAARNQVNKQGSTGGLKQEQGNCATFLLKVEGILDSLYQDLVSSGNTELKEKAKKILDIWVKSNTFPSSVLGRLSQYLKGEAEKEPDKLVSAPVESVPQIVPALPSNSQPAPPTTPANPSSVHSTLIALLSQAANAVTSSGQTISNTATYVPNPVQTPQANPLALLQQLTQAAKLGNGVSVQPIPVPVSLVPSSSSSNPVAVVPSAGGPIQPSPNRDPHYGVPHRESNHDRHDGPDRFKDRDEYYEDRHDHRGAFRGGPRGGFRGRGRGRWDDRDRYNDRSRDREWNPSRGRRSRSPPGKYGGRREIRAYSPPRRPSAGPYYRDRGSADPAGQPSVPQVVKDEFGRDIRSGSSDSTPTPSSSHPPPFAPRSATVHTSEPASTFSGSDIHSPVHDGSSSHSPTSRHTGTAATSEKGLDSFDVTTFDPASPLSWKALGDAWAVTHGYLPTQADLMQYVFSGSTMANTLVSNQPHANSGSQWSGPTGMATHQYDAQSGRGSWRGGRGRGRGRGGYGNGRDMDYADAWDEGSTGTNANPGQEFEVNRQQEWQQQPADSGNSDDPHRDKPNIDHLMAEGQNGGNTGVGRMQRVGDKWVFVRAGTSEVAQDDSL